jgi:hypothetical protein
MRHPLIFIALAASLGLAAAGCGSGDKNDYVKQLNKAVASLQTSLTTATAGLGSGDGTQVATKLESGGKAMDAAADNFDKIDPPSDAAHAHGEIVDGLHKLASTFRGAAKSARGNHLDAVVKTFQNFESSPGAQEIQKAQNELKDNGYKVAE